MATKQELDDTARLILMDIDKDGTVPGRVIAFYNEMKEQHPEVPLSTALPLWEKYMGVDGRILPTHSIYTGEPL